MSTWVFKLKLKNCERILDDDLGPGVLVQVEAEVSDEASKAQTAISLIHASTEFRDKYIEVEITPASVV